MLKRSKSFFHARLHVHVVGFYKKNGTKKTQQINIFTSSRIFFSNEGETIMRTEASHKFMQEVINHRCGHLTVSRPHSPTTGVRLEHDSITHWCLLHHCCALYATAGKALPPPAWFESKMAQVIWNIMSCFGSTLGYQGVPALRHSLPLVKIRGASQREWIISTKR